MTDDDGGLDSIDEAERAGATADRTRSDSADGPVPAGAPEDGHGDEQGALARLDDVLSGEFGRRLVHVSGIGVPLTYYVLTAASLDEALAWRAVQGLTIIGVLAGTALEVGRLRLGVDSWAFRKLTREYESSKVAGYALYLVGIAVVAVGYPALAWVTGVEFPIEAALTGMILLSVGDPLSGSLAADTPGMKGPRAIVPTLVVGTVIGVLVGLPAVAAVAAAVALVVADVRLWSIGDYVVDDNLTIPVAAGGVAWIAMLAS